MKKVVAKKNYAKPVLPVLAIALAYAGLAYTGMRLYDMNKIINQQQEQIQANRKVYFYNLEEVLRNINAISARTNFESEILKLNDEVLEAEKKIKTINDAKVKADFSDVYLNNLKLKREELIKQYENSVKNITDTINVSLAEVAAEKGVATIFVQNAIAVYTEDVEDVTDEIIKRVKKLVPAS